MRRKENNEENKENSKPSTEITYLSHDDKRLNIPTEELRDFLPEEERQPRTLLYPRDPSLDPQLVWQGKDEQDREALAVPVLPIYIQEKIHPRALIEDLRAYSQQGQPHQLDLFADFNHIPFEDLIEFYQHEQKWSNRLILGDSLQVMASLAEKEGLKGQVQMIYMDPPYGIKFGSNWQVRVDRRDVKDGKVEDLVRQPEQIKAFRDTWELGIHSYLSYLRDRLVVARELLTESGSIFVQIGDENVHLVRCVLDEVFGSENFVAIIPFRKKTMPLGTSFLEQMDDFLLWYAKEKEICKFNPLYVWMTGEKDWHYQWIEREDGSIDRLSEREINNHSLLPNNVRLFMLKSLEPSGPMPNGYFDYPFKGKIYKPPKNGFATTLDGMRRLDISNRIGIDGNRLAYKLFIEDYPISPLSIPWQDTIGPRDKMYVVQTSNEVIQRCILMTTDPGDLVLDPTCGSGTTAYVAEQWGRRWITIDTSRVAITLARARLMAARYPYYLLADSPEGFQKQKELGQIPLDAPRPASFGYEVRKGFVYKTVPHITLRDIANNEEIDVIHAKYQPQLDALRAEINRLTGQQWEEWEIPRLPSKYQSEEDRHTTRQELAALGITPEREAWRKLEDWWALRRQRQQEIDESIARHAGRETLYDQPYEDPKRIRVAGPFTVESLSPFRVLSPEVELPATERAALQDNSTNFIETILENLRKAGVQNTKKGERLKFDRLESYGGLWIQAEGEYTTKDGQTRRVAVAIGPEHGTVGPELVKEAAKEAVRGLGFDLLLVCGFAFDPHVSEETKRYGRLEVLPVRMNPDLAMGDTLLKKTGSGNLFLIFGEPDIEIHPVGDDQIKVKINGLDIYDPTTGEVRPSSVSDIACWFIDTNYNEESFFVRQAYFYGMDNPYEKLKRALRAEINAEAWETLCSIESRPFPKPQTGKIAVKVINHYGDEVMKVYQIE
jgi:adenine-specific DNA-methyltransferase